MINKQMCPIRYFTQLLSYLIICTLNKIIFYPFVLHKDIGTKLGSCQYQNELSKDIGRRPI